MQIARLLELRWTNYLNTISLHRGIEKEELVMEQNQTFLFSPESCKEKGLVDFITPHGKMLDTLLELGVEDEDSEEYAHVDLIDYVDRSSSTVEKDSSPEIVEAKLALVYIEGTIVEGGETMARLWEEMKLPSAFVKLQEMTITRPLSYGSIVLVEVSLARMQF